jgi:hypothetical protein
MATVNEPRAGRPNVPAGYGLNSDGPTLPWPWAEERLTAARNYWVATTRPGGRPHVMPVWGLWLQGAVYFGTNRASRKGQNLTANPSVVVHLESGDEAVIIEGVAAAVTDPQVLATLDAAYEKKYGLKMTGAPGDLLICAVQPVTAFGWLESDFLNATRWQFG